MERGRLIQENVRLKRENEELRADRDRWKGIAAEIAHINTYTCERMNSPLTLLQGGKHGQPDNP